MPNDLLLEIKANFILVLKELKTAFAAAGRGYLLTSAVSPGKDTIDLAYDIAALGKYEQRPLKLFNFNWWYKIYFSCL